MVTYIPSVGFEVCYFWRVQVGRGSIHNLVLVKKVVFGRVGKSVFFNWAWIQPISGYKTGLKYKVLKEFGFSGSTELGFV